LYSFHERCYTMDRKWQRLLAKCLTPYCLDHTTTFPGLPQFSLTRKLLRFQTAPMSLTQSVFTASRSVGIVNSAQAFCGQGGDS
jgi:putative hemolysin